MPKVDGLTKRQLRALLNVGDDDAVVVFSLTSPEGHGSFAFTITGVSQDRTTAVHDTGRQLGGRKEIPTLVLHGAGDQKVWTAKKHGKPTEPVWKMLDVNVSSWGSAVIKRVYVKRGVQYDSAQQLTDQCEIIIADILDIDPTVHAPVKFKDEDECRLFARSWGHSVHLISDWRETRLG